MNSYSDYLAAFLSTTDNNCRLQLEGAILQAVSDPAALPSVMDVLRNSQDMTAVFTTLELLNKTYMRECLYGIDKIGVQAQENRQLAAASREFIIKKELIDASLLLLVERRSVFNSLVVRYW